MERPVLEVRDVHHSYGDVEVVKGMDFALAKGQIGCLVGESGCGKTTMLRAIAGFERIKRGEITIDGETVSKATAHRKPEKRGVGMVFQDYALFPHLTVRDNILFGLRQLHKKDQRELSDQALETVGLSEVRNNFPHELSGGQQQRVALARALAPRPRLILLDEPFSNLDVTLRERLSGQVRDLIKAYGATALLVTHNQAEAFAVADEVGVVRDGRIEQWGTPYDVYHKPVSRYVAEFLGEGVFLETELSTDGTVNTSLGVIGRSPDGKAQGRVLLRPEDVLHDDAATRKALVVGRTYRGASFLYELELESGERIQSLVPSRCEHQVGELIGIRTDVSHLVVL